MITDNREYIACSLVIPIPKSDFTSLEMKERIQKFIRSLESRIGSYRKFLYNATTPNAIYYSSFDDDIKDENVDLPYSNDFFDVKIE